MNGALVIDKPEGLTSHDVVARVRRAADTRRAGHAGTLDPFATGVLVVCIGRATRLVQFLAGLDKEYLATVRLGYATDTQDRTGKQIAPLRTSNELSLEDLHRVLDHFTGPQSQMPPMFSAKKVGGEKLYRAARAGREIERDPISVTIYSLELLERRGDAFADNEDGTRDFSVRVRCSSGTYVRTIAHDMGQALGVGAHLAALRRVEVGHFRLSDALTLEEMESMDRHHLHAELIEPVEMLVHLPIISLDDQRITYVTSGRAVAISAEEESAVLKRADAPVRLCDGKGKLLAVGNYDRRLKLVKPRVVLASKLFDHED